MSERHPPRPDLRTLRGGKRAATPDELEADRVAQEAAAKLDTSTPGPDAGGPDPDYRPRDLTGRLIVAPAKVAVVLTCPSCNVTSTVEATLSARVVRDSDGSGSLALRTRAAKVGHVCGQQSLGLAEGPRSR